MDNVNEFWAGFVAGFTTFLVALIFIAGIASCNLETNYEYTDVDGMTCIRIDGELVSCDWSDKDR